MFRNYGYCYCCNQLTEFVAQNDWWRDFYLCGHCGSLPRERALLYSVEKFFPNWKNAVIYESSPAMKGASLRLQEEAPGYIPSQYFQEGKPGEIINGFRCEDLENLSFADCSIDLHITQDVFEHIFDPEKAFQEIARTLRPGGAHIFTTPLVKKGEPSELRARKNSDGSIEYVLPPEYHGNPIDEKGSLVTIYWGYEIVNFIHKACGLFTEMAYIDALEFGIRAEYNEVLITRKFKE